MLSKDAIFAADDLPRETVNVPEWGGDVIVRTMTGAERDAFEYQLMQAKKGEKLDGRGLKARMCVLTIVNEAGDPLFDDPSDVLTLQTKSAAVLNRLFEVSSRLNGLSDGDVEELAGNSPAAPSGDSGSS